MRPISRVVAGILLPLVVSLPSCSRKAAETEPAPEPPSSVVATTPPPATPAPATPMADLPTPAPRRLAPEGTFYLLVKKSVVTDDGVIGFKPGALVKREADGSFTAEGRKLDVKPGELTNDLDIAARYAGADAVQQAAIRQSASSSLPPAAATSASPTSATSRASRPAAASSGGGIVPPTKRVGSGLDASGTLGASHTMTRDGWLWQKDASGEWRRVKPLR